MKKINIFCRIIALILLVPFVSCSTTPYTASAPKVNFPQLQLLNAGRTAQRPAEQPFQIRLAQVQQAPAAQSSSPYYTGDGGRGKSIFIATPRGSGLSNDLLETVAVDLSNTFSKYSAITPFDRVTQMRLYEELESGLFDDRVSQDFGSLNTDYVLQGSITRTSTGYTLQLTVNRTTGDKGIAASYSAPVSLVELERLTGVRKASVDLLERLGVNLTTRAKNELAGEATADQVNAVIAMAQGINAQRLGTVDALTYYYMAENYDPSLAEAVRGATVQSANISTGNIGANIRNDIAWRDDWMAKLKETEDLMGDMLRNTTPQRFIWYSTDVVEQESARDYNRRTTELRIQAVLHTYAIFPISVQRTVQAVYDGLQTTNRAQAWSLNNWPRQGVTSSNPFNNRTWGSMITIVFEVLNEQGKVIGRQSVQMDSRYTFNGTSLSGPETRFTTVRFTGVNADDITDSLSIRIATINGQPPEQAGISRIEPMSTGQMQTNRNFTIYNGAIRLNSNDRNLGAVTIPAELWGERVTAIGNRVFENRGLTSVSIPSGVTTIGTSAFANNRLTSVVIPEGVTTIGDKAFADNHWTTTERNRGGTSSTVHHGLSSVTIPSSVTSIGQEAFYSHWTTRERRSDGVYYTEDYYLPTEVTIGANVRLGTRAIGNGFEAFYANADRQAGAYNMFTNKWERFDSIEEKEQTLASRSKSLQTLGIIGGILLAGGLIAWMVLNPNFFSSH